ncbi:hypothetical protein CSOJ01_13207 [Colletotrichum sojae]|uniref:Uncharacterized protein n=1 Tax=Colletotrichum sojae TaxID=2175907 RepID=A0A8H6ITD5_9PEZI|nr:hypothetical protein CSOJ01_13207 [Colletotrichum sojae]
MVRESSPQHRTWLYWAALGHKGHKPKGEGGISLDTTLQRAPSDSRPRDCTMSPPLLSSSAGFPHYERPLQAGPTPSLSVQGSKIAKGLKISTLPASEDWLAERWESHSLPDQPYYKQLAEALDHRGLAWKLLSLGQVRSTDRPIDNGHPSVVVGVADNSSENLVAEVA